MRRNICYHLIDKFSTFTQNIIIISCQNYGYRFNIKSFVVLSLVACKEITSFKNYAEKYLALKTFLVCLKRIERIYR